ncbi:unnamed protein product [Effrenium voratum]|uniref:Uncharacterized protein n=1 Tax=Effrenium voratum TaxID=2562239 RepID=A0AA36JFB1_9DINO|nr:unnamed protein product [Effrenium voratum]
MCRPQQQSFRCIIDESLKVTDMHFKNDQTRRPLLCIKANTTRNISNGTADLTVEYNPLYHKTLTFELCGSSHACPPSGVSQELCLGTVPWLLPGQLTASLELTGYTPGFSGLRVLACSYFLRWSVGATEVHV